MTCAEKSLAYELVPVPYGSEEHGALHPFRRIPILEVGETVIFETLAATGYVDEAFDGPSPPPAGAAPPRGGARCGRGGARAPPPSPAGWCAPPPAPARRPTRRGGRRARRSAGPN